MFQSERFLVALLILAVLFTFRPSPSPKQFLALEKITQVRIAEMDAESEPLIKFPKRC